MCHSDSLKMSKIYHGEFEDGDFATPGRDLGLSCRQKLALSGFLSTSYAGRGS